MSKKLFYYLLLLISAFVISYSINFSMPDDGLRHIAFAANMELMKSWGEVYPHSLFTSYDPWFAWHYLLKLLLQFISYDTIHIYINTFVLFTLLVLIDLHLRKQIKANLGIFFYIIVLSLLYLSSFRYLMVRPDLLSGLYVLMLLLLNKNRFFPVFIITLIYGPFYYLFPLYTGSLGLMFLIQKKIKSFLGVFLASIIVLSFFLLYDFSGYMDTIFNILNDQNLRMGLQVTEGQPIFSFFEHMNYYLLVPIFIITSGYLIFKYHQYFLKNSIALFLLITSILWINQSRYFSLLYPIILIYLVSTFLNSDKKYILYLFRKYLVVLKQHIYISKRSFLFTLLVIPIVLLFISKLYTQKSYDYIIEETKFFNESRFLNKTILFNRMKIDMFQATYHNPTLKIIPSCGIGWFENSDPQMKDIYIRMQKSDGVSEEELQTLIKYVNADFYIHYTKNDNQVLNFEKLQELGIIAEEIYHNRIIFKIRKD